MTRREAPRKVFEVWRQHARDLDQEVKVAWNLDEEEAYALWLDGANCFPTITWWIVEVNETRTVTLTSAQSTKEST